MMKNKSKVAKQVRAYVLSGSAERVRIMSDGAVHAYGIMPNTNHVGWYFVGWLEHIAAEMYGSRAPAVTWDRHALETQQ